MAPSELPFLGSTNQVVASVFGYRDNAENWLPAPPWDALLSDDLRGGSLAHTYTLTHTLTPPYTNTHTSICLLTLDPSRRRGTDERRVLP